MGGERQWGEESRRERRLGRHHRHHPLGHRPLDVDERVEGVGIRLRWAWRLLYVSGVSGVVSEVCRRVSGVPGRGRGGAHASLAGLKHPSCRYRAHVSSSKVKKPCPQPPGTNTCGRRAQGKIVTDSAWARHARRLHGRRRSGDGGSAAAALLLLVLVCEQDATPPAKRRRAVAEIGDHIVEGTANAGDELAVRRAVQPSQCVLLRR